jgi:hypothetical protein
MSAERKYFGFGKNVFLAGLVSFFMDISSEMIYPLVPLFLAGALGVNKSTIGLIEGVAEATASLLIGGLLWDRVSHHPPPFILELQLQLFRLFFSLF